jgi:hypothetical protein
LAIPFSLDATLANKRVSLQSLRELLPE